MLTACGTPSGAFDSRPGCLARSKAGMGLDIYAIVEGRKDSKSILPFCTKSVLFSPQSWGRLLLDRSRCRFRRTGINRGGVVDKYFGGCMDTTKWLVLAVFVVGLIALIGFFCTKTKGFGRFATSTFLLVLVFTVSSLLCAAGKLEGQVFTNIVFAIIGFAGGLFTGKKHDIPSPGPQKTSSVLP